MTPRRREGDLSTSKLSLRDVLLLVVGACSMYGVQLGAQWGMRSDIRDIKTSFEAAIAQQGSTNASLQRQIDDWRAETKLNRVNNEATDRALAELKGILLAHEDLVFAPRSMQVVIEDIAAMARKHKAND